MKTINEMKAEIENATGKKFTVSKNKGSMKHYITFSVKGRANGEEVDFNIGRLIAEKHNCYFSNNNNFSILKSQLCLN